MEDKAVIEMIVARYRGILEDAVRGSYFRPETLAGIMMRESRGGLALDEEGKGDGKHGHGLFQIDDRSFPDFCSSDLWRYPAPSAGFAVRVLEGKRKALSVISAKRRLIVGDLYRASVAAYNCGEGNVLKAIEAGLDVDHYTAHSNYSLGVLRYAIMYLDVVSG